MKKILLILPTLNEANNIKKLYRLINKLNFNFTYLFIDHGSIDGTQKIIKNLQVKNPKKNFIIQKKFREGVGKAHKDGLKWAFKNKFQLAITMDTDFAHHPNYINKLLKNIKNYDLVVG